MYSHSRHTSHEPLRCIHVITQNPHTTMNTSVMTNPVGNNEREARKTWERN